MPVLPRVMVFAALLVTATSPMAAANGADGCWSMELDSYAPGLSIVAQTGSVIKLGFTSGAPGDGIGYVLVIAPALCTGGGLPIPIGGVGQQGAYGLLDSLPDLIPLP